MVPEVKYEHMKTWLSPDKHIQVSLMSTTVKLKANCNDSEGEDRKRNVYLQLIPVVVQQKSIQHHKAIILQFKINLKKIKQRQK